MTDDDSKTEIKYPETPEEWQVWLLSNLGIDQVRGRHMTEEDVFPFSNLIEAWQQEFTTEKGFSPNFIPALTRNRRGFIRWVYLQAPEPNWSKSDI